MIDALALQRNSEYSYKHAQKCLSGSIIAIGCPLMTVSTDSHYTLQLRGCYGWWWYSS